jgi:hypothetical protein
VAGAGFRTIVRKEGATELTSATFNCFPKQCAGWGEEKKSTFHSQDSVVTAVRDYFTSFTLVNFWLLIVLSEQQ